VASIPGFRFDITGASGSQNLLSPKAGWRCFILPRGGYASADSTGTLITFDSASVASRFAVNDWIQAGTLVTNIRQVGSVGGNSINVSGAALTISENQRILLIGSTEPTVTGGSATYTPRTTVRQRDDDAADVYTNSMITTNSDGLAQGFCGTALYDLLIQDGNQANQGSLIDMPVGVPEGISVSDWAFFGSTVTIHGALGVTGTATFGGQIIGTAGISVSAGASFSGNLSVTGDLLISGGLAVASALGNIRWAHLYATGSETGGIQEAINSITDASATNPYTVMLRPGVYTVDRGISSGTQTGTAGFTANVTTVTGVGTSFQSTIALTGTVTMTTANAAVTGSSTLFTTELQIGDHIQMTVDADDGAGTDHSGLFGRILSIQSNTALTLEVVGEGIYDGAGGTGAARFREFRVGDHIKAGADADTAYTRITSIASDTSLTINGAEILPPVSGQVGYQGTTLAGATVAKKTFYQFGFAMYGLKANGGWNTGPDAKDYITIAGVDKAACVIRRDKAAGGLTGVVQACDHMSISNVTIWCNGTRHVHWDTKGYLRCAHVRFRSAPASLTSAGLSTGIESTTTESSVHRISDCEFEYTTYSCHSNADALSSLANFIWLTANTFTDEGNIVGLDLSTAGANSLYHILLSGNVQKSSNVDSSSGGVGLVMPTTVVRQPNVRVYTDGGLRFSDPIGGTASNSADYQHNAVIYPMERLGYRDVAGSSSGDVLIYRPVTADLGTTTSVAAQWPVIVCNQTDNAGTATWWPRLCTGPYGACFVEAGTTVTVGDVLVTSGTSWAAGVSNTITDMTKVIGWASSGKTAGTTRGLVNFRRNMTLNW